ncbi:MAG: universal stress protein [Pirellulales bacterium]|nr:universal stress protein [Pirellulales bacterium]
MKLLEKILVATDFTSGANDALQMAVFVAKHFRSEIILLHVVPGISNRYSSAEGMIRTDVEEVLQDTVNRIREEGIKVVQTIVDFGIPFDQIIHHADQQNVNVVIMAANDGTNGGQRGLGTTAAEVRRRASKPVCIVKPGFAPPIRNILCPVDFSDASGRALRNAIHLARHLQAELTMLTVAPCLDESEKMRDAVAEAKQRGVEEEPVMLDHFVQDFDLHGVQSKKMVRQGKHKPHEEILQVIAEMQSDLLVMGSSSRNWLARMLMGGVARKVAQEIPCSIVTVRSEHAVRVRLDDGDADVEEHFKQGHELLALGFPVEAERQFRHCIAKDNMHIPALEGLAAVCERLGRLEEAKKYEKRAEQAAQTLYHRQIQADIRGQHPLFRPLFGIKDDNP